MNISILRLLKVLPAVLLYTRTQPFFADILTSLFFQYFVPLQIHFNEPIFFKSSHLYEALEYFDTINQRDFVKRKVDVLNLVQMEQVIGKLGD